MYIIESCLLSPSHVTDKKIQTLDKIDNLSGRQLGFLQVKESLGGTISVRDAPLKKPFIYSLVLYT